MNKGKNRENMIFLWKLFCIILFNLLIIMWNENLEELIRDLNICKCKSCECLFIINVL